MFRNLKKALSFERDFMLMAMKQAGVSITNLAHEQIYCKVDKILDTVIKGFCSEDIKNAD